MTTEFLLPSAQVRVDSSVECQLPPLMSILWYPQEDWAVVTLSAEEVTWRIVSTELTTTGVKFSTTSGAVGVLTPPVNWR